MSVVGSWPCCWPLAVTFVARRSEGFSCIFLDHGVPSDKEAGIIAVSVSGMECAGWAVVGDVGNRDWRLKMLDNMSSLFTVMLLKAAVLPSSALVSPGHAVLCGGENIPPWRWQAWGAGT